MHSMRVRNIKSIYILRHDTTQSMESEAIQLLLPRMKRLEIVTVVFVYRTICIETTGR